MTDAALDDIRRRFRERCAAELDQLTACAGRPDADAAQAIHRLAGLAGALGFDELSRLARRVEDGASLDGEAPAADWAGLLAELGRVAQAR